MKREPKPTPEITEGMWADYQSGLTVEEVAGKWGCTVGVVYRRFREARLPLRKANRHTAPMYFDYCLGMELEQVAKKWGYSPNNVRHHFKGMRLPLRKPERLTCRCRVRNPHNVTGLSFAEANQRRTIQASEHRCAKAAIALKTETNPIYRSVLKIRVENPTATLTEMAYLHDPPMTKDAFAAVLRPATTGITA